MAPKRLLAIFILLFGLSEFNLCQAQDPKPAKAEPVIAGRPLADWIKDLKSDNVALKNQALSFIETQKEHASHFQATLIELSSADKSFAIRSRAVQTLAKLQLKNDTVRDAHLKALEDKSWQVRAEAARALVEYGPDAEPARDKLLAMVLSERAWFAKIAAAAAIGEMGEKARPVVPKLKDAMINDDAKVREAVILALGELGPVAVKASPQLMIATQDAVPAVKRNACIALARCCPDIKPIFERFEELIRAAERVDTLAAVYGLEVLAEKHDHAIELLVESLSQDDYVVQSYALRALAKFGLRSESARNRAAELRQKSPSSKTRSAAQALLYALSEAERAKAGAKDQSPNEKEAKEAKEEKEKQGPDKTKPGK